MDKVKNINSLMKYLRNEKHIKCDGSHDKLILRNMGYFHGYKGYRIYKNCQMPINSIDEIKIIQDYDMNLKTIIYPQIMFVETVLKNYCIEEILNYTKSQYFIDCFNKAMIRYKDYSGKDRRDLQSKQVSVRSKVYQELTNYYKNGNIIVSHFYDNNKSVPIWAIIELLTLGEFANFLCTLDKKIIQNINEYFNIRRADDNNYDTLSKLVFMLKSLRNSVAHNDIIFDARFVDRKVNNHIKKLIYDKYKIEFVNFNTLEDYIILIVFFLQGMNVSKTNIKKFLIDCIDVINKFVQEIKNKKISENFVHANKMCTKLQELLKQI